MRYLPLLLLMTIPVWSAASDVQYPQWDGHESVRHYAQRAHLAPTMNLDLGAGVVLELVLIPAGSFIMGTPKPTLDDSGLIRQIALAKGLSISCCAGLALLAVALTARALRHRARPQLSLLLLLLMTLSSGGALLSGLHWRHSSQTLDLQREILSFVSYELISDNEMPAHRVVLTRPFYMGKFTVTRSQYLQTLRTDPSIHHDGPGSAPVDHVSWDAAQKFCTIASRIAGADVRLPTEAEWEFACRAGLSTGAYSGEELVQEFNASGSHVRIPNLGTNFSGREQPNAFGLYNMIGSVPQWCRGWYWYSRSPITDPVGDSDSYYRVIRGGESNSCRAASREWMNPDDTGNFGLRVVVPVSATFGEL